MLGSRASKCLPRKRPRYRPPLTVRPLTVRPPSPAAASRRRSSRPRSRRACRPSRHPRSRSHQAASRTAGGAVAGAVDRLPRPRLHRRRAQIDRPRRARRRARPRGTPQAPCPGPMASRMSRDRVGDAAGAALRNLPLRPRPPPASRAQGFPGRAAMPSRAMSKARSRTRLRARGSCTCAPLDRGQLTERPARAMRRRTHRGQPAATRLRPGSRAPIADRGQRPARVHRLAAADGRRRGPRPKAALRHRARLRAPKLRPGLRRVRAEDRAAAGRAAGERARKGRHRARRPRTASDRQRIVGNSTGGIPAVGRQPGPGTGERTALRPGVATDRRTDPRKSSMRSNRWWIAVSRTSPTMPRRTAPGGFTGPSSSAP